MNLFEACLYLGITRDYVLYGIQRIDPAKMPPIIERAVELSLVVVR